MAVTTCAVHYYRRLVDRRCCRCQLSFLACPACAGGWVCPECGEEQTRRLENPPTLPEGRRFKHFVAKRKR